MAAANPSAGPAPTVTGAEPELSLVAHKTCVFPSASTVGGLEYVLAWYEASRAVLSGRTNFRSTPCPAPCVPTALHPAKQMSQCPHLLAQY